MTIRSVESAYAAAMEAALIVRHPAPSLVIAKGKDRLDLLQRMSTNDVAGMEIGSFRTTVLTNPIGRIVEAVGVLSLADEAWLLTSPGQAAAVQAWLGRYIFFQDDVQLARGPEGWSEWGVYGPGSEEALAGLYPRLARPGGDSAILFKGGHAWNVTSPAGGGFHLLLDPDETERASAACSGRGGEATDSAAYQILRIEAGLPEPVSEIRQEYIPLEVGLRDAISFSKGCYIGQEIIARMDSRGRQARTLVGVRLTKEANPGDGVKQDHRNVGSVTSVAHSPRLGWIALAIVRPVVVEEGPGHVHVGESGSEGEVVRLPFAPVSMAAGS